MLFSGAAFGWLSSLLLGGSPSLPAPTPEISTVRVEVTCATAAANPAFEAGVFQGWGFALLALFLAWFVGVCCGLCAAGSCGGIWALTARRDRPHPAALEPGLVGRAANARLALYGYGQ